MNLNSVTQSPAVGQQITNKPKAGGVNGYQDLRESIDVVVQGLDDEHKQMDKQINEIKTQQVETQKKAKKNSKLGTIILTASTIGCFGLAAMFHGQGVPALPGLACILLPWAFLFLSAKSNSQYREAAQKDQQVVEVKQKQAEVVQQKEWWNEKKEMTEVLETDKEDNKMGKDGKPRKIVDEPTQVIIGGVPLEKRKKG